MAATTTSPSSPNQSTQGSNGSQSQSKNPNSSVIPAVTGTLVGILIIILLFFYLVRLRTRRRDILGARGERVGKDHLAARIVPFGSAGGETPRFHHTPGENMRIATRRSDGVWLFADSRAPFSPSGVSDLENTPSPSSTTPVLAPWRKQFRDSASEDARSTISYSSTAAGSTLGWKSRERLLDKERERLKGEPGAAAWSEYAPSDILPPPAYAYGRKWDDGLSPGSAIDPLSTPGPRVDPLTGSTVDLLRTPSTGTYQPEMEGGYLMQSRFSMG